MTRAKLTVGLVQEKWSTHQDEHLQRLASGVHEAARQGADVVCMQELTLSPYFCTRPDVDPAPYMEDLHHGPTTAFFSALAKKANVAITASLFEHAGYNTAVAYNARGELTGFTRKQHIPSGEKYHEDYYFKPGDSDYPLHRIVETSFALPTCYDQWFPELSRIYGLKGAEVIVYPTAIGAEPTAPDFDSQPSWQKVMVAQGIMANTFMIAVNRIGVEDGLQFYGSSFISSPLGHVLAQAPRDEACVLVAELDMQDRALWGRLFPFAKQREAHTYHALTQCVAQEP